MCNIEKNISDFYFRKERNYYHDICKDCHMNSYNNLRSNNKKILIEYKNRCCEICGYEKCLDALEFHHHNPSDKEFELKSIRYNKKISEKVRKELDKCHLLCSNCHRETHGGFHPKYIDDYQGPIKRTTFYENSRNKKLKKMCVEYKGNCCEYCGYKKYIGALDFHHKDPTKKDFGIAKCSTKKFEGIKKELDKCLMLCSNCHREEHHILSFAEEAK